MQARDAVLAAGARLMAERGVEGVSLREITRAAGQRNVTALQYHFEDREGLLRAIVEPHARDIAEEVTRQLDRLDTTPSPSAHQLVRAVSLPLVGRLRAPGGTEFLQLAAQLVNRAGQVPDESDPVVLLAEGYEGVFQRWAVMLEPHMSSLVVEERLHQRFAALRFAYGELGRRGLTHEKAGPSPLFEAHLTDLMVAIIVAVPSPETVAAFALRRQS